MASNRAVRAAVQGLESLQRAGITHLPKQRRKPVAVAAEAAVALAIFLNLYRLKATAQVDKADKMKW